ncbi:MAG: DUF560 domain-containing protein [Betaproteobacteria bacterium]|nr:DUF560 domain-containing protein [Betaproteobacteria bacterium]
MAADVPGSTTGPSSAQKSFCQQAASKVEDRDKAGWLYASGECALQRRQYREAIGFFTGLIGIDANPIYRAELGRAYLGAQEFEHAREQFLIAMQGNPPEEAKRLLRIFIQMADQQRTQAKEWFASASLGALYDSNINSGPSGTEVLLYGLPFTMSQDSMPKSDQAIQAAFSLVHNRSLNQLTSWQTVAALDAVSYMTYHGFDTSQLSIDSGPHFMTAGGKTDLYLPLGLSRTTLGGIGYVAATYFTPQTSYLLSYTDLLVTSIAVVRSRYAAAPARDSTASGLGVAWRHVMGNRWTIEPALKFTSERAQTRVFDNLARSASLSVSGSLPYGLRFAAANIYTWADFKEAEAWAEAPRKDRRINSSLSLSKAINGGYYATLSWLESSIHSNLGLYSTARRQIQLQLSKSF